MHACANGIGTIRLRVADMAADLDEDSRVRGWEPGGVELPAEPGNSS